MNIFTLIKAGHVDWLNRAKFLVMEYTLICYNHEAQQYTLVVYFTGILMKFYGNFFPYSLKAIPNNLNRELQLGNFQSIV